MLRAVLLRTALRNPGVVLYVRALLLQELRRTRAQL
jgi:hypothetical protein